MKPYEIYTLIICSIVYVGLTALFTALIVCLLRLTVRLIRSGAEDEKIFAEYKKAQKKKKKKNNAGRFLEGCFTGLVCAIMFFAFGFSVYTHYVSDNVTSKIPTYRVVLSGSMSKKYEKNKYLFENNLNDQFSQFDLILTHELPAEKDLKLFDIVVYEVDDSLVIHRIVGIEEPNEKHPNERYFRLQGDNVHIADKFPVKYSQMKAIYKGQRIPHVGSFIAFLQSPAGYMCFILVFLGVIFIPLMDKKIEKEKSKRLRFVLAENAKGQQAQGQACNGCSVCHGVVMIPIPQSGKETLEENQLRYVWLNDTLQQ